METYHVRSIKRVHDQAVQSLRHEDVPSSESVANRFNEIVDELQAEYPDMDRLQDIEPVEGTKASLRRHTSVNKAKEELREIKLQSLKIADLFELDVDAFEQVSDREELTVINVEQNTQVSQSIEFDSLIEQVEGGFVSGEDEDVLKEVIREYQEEIESEGTDDSKLRELVDRAKGVGAGVGQQVATKLAMIGLQQGYDLLP